MCFSFYCRVFMCVLCVCVYVCMFIYFIFVVVLFLYKSFTSAAPSSPLHSPLTTHARSPSLISYRRLHALLAPAALALLSFALITGEAYRFSRNALGYAKDDARYLLL